MCGLSAGYVRVLGDGLDFKAAWVVGLGWVGLGWPCRAGWGGLGWPGVARWLAALSET